MNAAPSNKTQGRKPSRKTKVRGIWLHKNGFWYFTKMRNGQRSTVALGTQNEMEAAKLALELVDSPELGLPGEFQSEINAFIASKLAANKFSRFTATQRKTVLLDFMRWLGDDPKVSKVTTSRVLDFYHHKKLSVKETTAQSYIVGVLGSFFTWLEVERKVILKSPVQDIQLPRLDTKSAAKSRFCAEELRDQILAGWENIPEEILDKTRARWIGFVLHAGFDAGMRKNEIIEARPEWFVLKNKTGSEVKGVINVGETSTFMPKDREARTIPMSKVLVSYLQKHPFEKGTWCIAPEKVRGKAEYRYDFERPFKIYIEWIGKELKMDLGWVTPHIMRHTFASLLPCSNVSLYKITKWLGDTMATTEKHYAHLQAEDDDVDQLRTTKKTELPMQH